MACARLRARRPSEPGRSRLLLALSDRLPGRAGRGEGQGTAGRRSRAQPATRLTRTGRRIEPDLCVCTERVAGLPAKALHWLRP